MRKALAISPRNEGYLYNLANLYLADRQPDQAIALLESLRGTDNPALASQVGAALAQAQRFKQMLQAGASGPPAGVVLVRKEDSAVNSQPAMPSGTSSSGTPAGMTNFGAAKFIRGTLGSVDCSTEPAATLTILSGSQTLKMQIADKPCGADWRRPVFLLMDQPKGGSQLPRGRYGQSNGDFFRNSIAWPGFERSSALGRIDFLILRISFFDCRR